MATFTTNYNLIKPAVADPTDQDLWGGYLNQDMDNIDGLMKQAMDFVPLPVTGAYSILVSDRKKVVLGDATGGSFTVTLPPVASATAGFTVAVKKTSATNSVTVDGNAAELIDGAATYVIDDQYESAIFSCDGTGWVVIAEKKAINIPSASTSVAGIIQLATDAEAKAGAVTDKAIVPSSMKAAIGYSNRFQSSQIDLSAVTYSTTVAHGLGAVPSMISAQLIVTTVTGDYSVGEAIDYASISLQDAHPVCISCNSTNLIISRRAQTFFTVINKTTGGAFNIPYANARLVVRAWA